MKPNDLHLHAGDYMVMVQWADDRATRSIGGERRVLLTVSSRLSDFDVLEDRVRRGKQADPYERESVRGESMTLDDAQRPPRAGPRSSAGRAATVEPVRKIKTLT